MKYAANYVRTPTLRRRYSYDIFVPHFTRRIIKKGKKLTDVHVSLYKMLNIIRNGYHQAQLRVTIIRRGDNVSDLTSLLPASHVLNYRSCGK